MENIKQDVKKEVKEKKAKIAKPKKQTAVGLLLEQAIKGGKDRAEIVAKAKQASTTKNILKNSLGFTIGLENLASLLNAMCRDIANERKGWWSTYKIVEVEADEEKHVVGSFKLVLK